MNGAEVSPVEIPTAVDLLAVFVAGIAGALIAARRDFDITGVIFLAVISGLGGGILRDTLIQRGTPVAFTNSNYLIVAFIAATVGFFFSQRMGRIDWVFTMFSALSLGLYTLVGVLKGLEAGLPTLSVLMLGIITAAGGGILLDVLLTRTPTAFLPGAPYALLSLVGGIMVVLLDEFSANEEWMWWFPVVAVVALRFAALRFGWTTPVATDLPGRVHGMVPMPTVPSKVRMPRLRRQPDHPEGRPDGD
jgi:uncharacterized membrane protein YeiH